MTEGELLENLSTENGISVYKLRKLFKSFKAVGISTLIEGNKFTLMGLGYLKPIIIKEKKGVNPKTLEKLIIPEHTRARFKASLYLKNGIKGKKV